MYFHEEKKRLHRCLAKEKTQVSEKVVRCIMHEEGLNVKVRKKRKYNSYQGEIIPAVLNLVERNFHAMSPKKRLLTDITKFAIPAGKAYLSPITDCFDGLLVAWRIGTSPNAELVNGMLDDTIVKLVVKDHPNYTHQSWMSLSFAGVNRVHGAKWTDTIDVKERVLS